ncbi:hypothetical protein P5V15_005730 [Pogonomyrmex californicus]
MASRRIQPPALTKTQALRQARSAAVVKEYERKQRAEAERRAQPVAAEPVRRRRYVPAEPKKVEFTRPAMTKTMLARVKHAEKFKQEYERKREEAMPRRPRRTPAPIGGDPRFGRERVPRPRRVPSPPISPPRPTRRPERRALERRVPEPAIPQRTKELARSMNAQVIQAEPIGEGPIDSIVIPPRSVDENRTTIVSIPQPPAVGIPSEVANRSIRVISETLDEQDDAEAFTVQGKLEDLQQARRDFVMAVANVGGNAVQLMEEERPRYRVPPDIESEMFRIEYGLEHPSVVAAREFVQRSMAGIRAREAARQAEREFERIAEEPLAEELRFDVPFEEEFLREGEISWEEREDIPVPSRIKTTMRDIPRRVAPYEYPPFEPEELERFFDIEQYPPSPLRGPPPGREHLPPELWELEDPWAWYRAEPDVADLIRFESP